MLASCGSRPPRAPLTAQVIADHGTHRFRADRARVIAALEGALRTFGYEVAFSDPEAGVVKTAPKNIAAVASGSYGYAALITVSHAYAIRVYSSDGGTTVEATPRLYRNGTDVSNGPWVFEGPGGQYEEWNKLFAEVASNLGEIAPAAAPPAAKASQDSP